MPDLSQDAYHTPLTIRLERWLSWQGLPSLPKRRAPWDKRRIQTQEAAKRTLPGSTEALARQFLDPVVDDALVDEYDEWVHTSSLCSPLALILSFLPQAMCSRQF